MNIKDIHILIGIGLIIVTAAATVLGTIKFAIPNLRENLGKLARRVKALEDKVPEYVTIKTFKQEIGRLDHNCEAHRNACQALICGRLDDVRGDLKTMDTKRERAREETVPKSDFEHYKQEMKGHVRSIEHKIDSQGELLTRLDERVGMLLKKNGVRSA